MRTYSTKFWIIFWTLSAVFLCGWFLFWNIKNNGIAEFAQDLIGFLPMKSQQKEKYLALASMGEYLFKKDGDEKKILFLFLNNMELRPGGGFIGAIGVVKMKNSQVQIIQTHDLSNFDARIPTGIEPPYPMKEIGYVENWKLRDSNFSPDFKTNADKAKEFYALAGANANFDAVIGVTSNVLSSILEITGPIKLHNYPGTYDSGNAILALEYQVEKAFEQQGIEREDRKSIMADLAEEIENRVFQFNASQKIKLLKTILLDLDQKDIQLNFANENIQQKIRQANWDGSLDVDWRKDYLMIVDANLGAFKSDYYVRRSVNYSVDLSTEKPTATLEINYFHTAAQRNWMTRNYLSYLRIYVPKGSKLLEAENFDDHITGSEFDKNFFGAIVKVPIAESKKVKLVYELPPEIVDGYQLKIQKQAGITEVPFEFVLKNIEEKEDKKKFIMNKDMIWK